MANQLVHKKSFYHTGRIQTLILLLMGSFLMMSISSCTKPHAKFACIKYTKADIAKWLAENKHTAGFALQFYSTQGIDVSVPFQAISYPMDSSKAYLMPPDTLGIQSDSAAKSFDGKIILGNNWLSRKKINNIFYPGGPGTPELDFDFILLVPKLDDSNTRHVVYDLKVFKGTKEIPVIYQAGSGETKPSPPAPPED
jgi:hypothetical protein